jgi:hypothetical protein
MNPQLKGIEQLSGTYVFDLRTSHRAFRINRFFWRLTEPAWRERFVADPEGLMHDADLTEQEQQLVRSRDWIGLLRYGTNFFVMEKIARVLKLSNLEVYAAMRGESLDDFLKTRRVPDCR